MNKPAHCDSENLGHLGMFFKKEGRGYGNLSMVFPFLSFHLPLIFSLAV
jgi:hypothetical protein